MQMISSLLNQNLYFNYILEVIHIYTEAGEALP